MPRRASTVSPSPAVREHLDRVRRDVGGRWVDHGAEIAEGQLADQAAGVVGVEGAPPAVARLHSDHPLHAALDGRGQAGMLVRGAPREGEHDLGGVVDVGVDVVGELEGPAGRGEVGPAYRPVAGHRDLLIEQPLDGLVHDRVGRLGARVEQAGEGEAGVPHGGLAGLEPAVLAVGGLLADQEPVEAGDCRGQAGVLERIAEQVQREDRVDPGRLDAAPAAVGFLTGEDPLGRPAHGQRAAGMCRQAVVELQGTVEQAEPARHQAGLGRLTQLTGRPGPPGTATRSSATLNGSGRTGRSVATTVIGTTVCRAQQAQS